MATIVWDCDDVLNDLMADWLVWWHRHRGTGPIRYEDVTENPPDRLLGIDRGEYLASLDEFRLSPEAASMSPSHTVLQWFERYGANHDHVVLTARPTATVAPAASWVFTHFAPWIHSFCFVPSPRNGSSTRTTKAEAMLRWRRVDLFVDDSHVEVDEAIAAGIPALLFPQPWNGSKESREQVLDRIREIVG